MLVADGGNLTWLAATLTVSESNRCKVDVARALGAGVEKEARMEVNVESDGSVVSGKQRTGVPFMFFSRRLLYPTGRVGCVYDILYRAHSSVQGSLDDLGVTCGSHDETDVPVIDRGTHVGVPVAICSQVGLGWLRCCYRSSLCSQGLALKPGHIV